MVDVAAQIAARLDTIPGLRVFPYPADSVHEPAAIVAFPDRIDFDATYGRGMDTVELPVYIVVGRASDRKGAEKALAYWSGDGAFSIKAAVDRGVYTAFDVVRVVSAEPEDAFTMAGTVYISVKFMLEIAGRGSA